MGLPFCVSHFCPIRKGREKEEEREGAGIFWKTWETAVEHEEHISSLSVCGCIVKEMFLKNSSLQFLYVESLLKHDFSQDV